MSKKVYIFGDIIEDVILVRDNPRDLDHSSNPDLFTHDKVKIYTKHTGTPTLLELLDKLSENITILNRTQITENLLWDKINQQSVKSNLKTFSEWVKDDDGKLFLVDQAGEDEIDTISHLEVKQSNNKDIVDSEIISVYNMSDTLYYSDSVLSRIAEKAVVQHIVIRTMFHDKENKDERITNFLKLLSKYPTLVNKTILVFDVNELRQGGFNVPKGVSWESLLKDTIRSLKDIPQFDSLEAIVACFNYEGCLVCSRENVNKDYSYRLFFYVNEIENAFVTREQKRVSGTITTMQASLIRALSDSTKTFEKQLDDGVERGLRAMRTLLKTGFEKDANFPYKEIVTAITSDDPQKKEENPVNYGLTENDLLSFANTATSKQKKDFSIIDACVAKDLKITLYDICKQIVTNGKTEKNFPFLRYGNLITYDKLEIERLRYTYYLFCSYFKNTKINKPLSICVFGPPGSGKSFAIVEIANAIVEIKKKKIFTFNMSQMKEPNELALAFHQIRDAGLKGDFPIVFFDEFDSKYGIQEFGWLKYFLAPMQDGEFIEEGVSHFIGRAIFVFAGGTCVDMDEFKNKARESDPSTKARDFLSRLKGYINVLGPNPMRCPHCKEVFKDNPEKCRRFSNIINDISNDTFLKKCQKVQDIVNTIDEKVQLADFLNKIPEIKKIINDIGADELLKHVEEIQKTIKTITDGMSEEEFLKKIQEITNITNYISADELEEKIKKIKKAIENVNAGINHEALLEKFREIATIITSSLSSSDKVTKIRETYPPMYSKITGADEDFLKKVTDTIKPFESSEETSASITTGENQEKAQEFKKILNDINDIGNHEFLKKVPKIIDLIRAMADEEEKNEYDEYMMRIVTEIKQIIDDIARKIAIHDSRKAIQEIEKITSTILDDTVLNKIQYIQQKIHECSTNPTDMQKCLKIGTELKSTIEYIIKEELQKKVQDIKKILPIVLNDISDEESQRKSQDIKKILPIVLKDISDEELQKNVWQLIDEQRQNKIKNNTYTNAFMKTVQRIEKCAHTDTYCRNEQWDATYMLRRASLLRSVLEKKLDIKNEADIERKKTTWEKKKIMVDDNVLNAFMNVETYLYGTRSLEAIVQNSEITRGKRFSARCISTNGLELYVDKTFQQLLNEKQKQPKIGKLLCVKKTTSNA